MTAPQTLLNRAARARDKYTRAAGRDPDEVGWETHWHRQLQDLIRWMHDTPDIARSIPELTELTGMSHATVELWIRESRRRTCAPTRWVDAQLARRPELAVGSARDMIRSAPRRTLRMRDDYLIAVLDAYAGGIAQGDIAAHLGYSVGYVRQLVREGKIAAEERQR